MYKASKESYNQQQLQVDIHGSSIQLSLISKVDKQKPAA